MDFIRSKKISISDFERISNLSVGYVHKIKNTVGKRALGDIQRAFPDLNANWLLTGEGEMLIDPMPQGIIQHQNGGTSNSQSVMLGHSDIGRLLDEISAQRRMTEKAQEQIDKLIALLENK